MKISKTKAMASSFVQGIRDGQRFVDVARRVTCHKTVVAQYVGGSASGARAGSSHNGAMAGPDFLYNGTQQAGIIREAVSKISRRMAGRWLLNRLAKVRRCLNQLRRPGNFHILILAIWSDWMFPVRPIQLQCRRSNPRSEPHASASNPVDLTFDLSTEKSWVPVRLPWKSGEVDASSCMASWIPVS